MIPQVFLPSELTLLANTGVWTRWWTSGTDLGREGHWYWASSLAPLPGTGVPSDPPHIIIDNSFKPQVLLLFQILCGTLVSLPVDILKTAHISTNGKIL